MKTLQPVKPVPTVACRISPVKAIAAAKPVAYPKGEAGPGEEEGGWRFVHGHAIYISKPQGEEQG